MQDLPRVRNSFLFRLCALVVALQAATANAGETSDGPPVGLSPGPVAESDRSATAGALGLSRWAISAAWHHYSESLMRLAGPAVGLRADRPFRAADRSWVLAGEVSAGRADYSSPVSGEITGVPRIGSGFFVGPGWRPDRVWLPLPELGLTTEWTDLRGRSTAQQNGYERFNLSLWLGASWTPSVGESERTMRLRAALMLSGWQRSMLAQAGSQLQNATNTQRRGLMLSLEHPWQWGATRASMRLSLRAVGQSDVVDAGARQVYEPTNRTLELGLSFWQ